MRTVKGCLSAIVFKREGENQWTINEGKVPEFIKQANEKLGQFFEKLKRNFPRYDEIRVYQQSRKSKKLGLKKACEAVSQPKNLKQEKINQKIV